MSKSPAKTTWTPETLAMLGTMTDSALARQLGVSIPYVAAQRRALGVPPHGRKPRQSATESAGPLGQASAAEVVVRLSAQATQRLIELTPIIEAKFMAQGLPVARLRHWQVAEFCINQVWTAAMQQTKGTEEP